ncbi:CRISPR-associated endonuclease Cas2 [Metamycoplasma phocicerebrale]|uniref:CRISPR-associated endoribonuclease Cas2 n=1 Tax=Metamycoplasma phocicerebrale TaxID=142649 RepID=A0A3Q9VBY5_9BACT|nr:CRISPR-associated endonuclease Cas2 [Metamycoplasma phocicerebrale]AZZ65802.1 CRISPR-associated endonuclease Cas2 [Metamycoplasma phocicerebrale]
MKIILMYDVSMDEDNLTLYNKFRNSLIKLGYFRIQYSIYVKTIGFQTLYPYEKEKLMKIIPKKSNVRVLLVTENQYSNMDILMGEKSLNEYCNEKERYIEL